MKSIHIYESTKANSSTIWMMFLFLGWSYGSLGKMGTQIMFYLTLGGFGVWTLVRFFTLNDSIKQYNREVAIHAGLKSDDLIKLGLI